MLDEWIDSFITIKLTDSSDFRAKLLGHDQRGLMLELHHSKDAPPPFEGITEARQTLIYLPWIRITGLVKASKVGLQ